MFSTRMLGFHRLYMRAFSTTFVADAKTGHFLHKLIAKSKTRLPNMYVNTARETVVPTAHKKPQEVTQRQKVLNAVFMENISNIMFAGEIGERLQGYGIELTEVRVSADCAHLNVYWITSLSQPGIHEKIFKLLLSCCGLLRSELIACQFMGKVPKITFVHDANHWRACDVQELIDRVCLEVQQDEQEHAKLDDHCCHETEEEKVEDQGMDSSSMQCRSPPGVPSDMRMNIFGLDRETFMRELNSKAKRTRGTVDYE